MYFFIHILFLIYIERKNSVNQKLYTTCIKSLWRYFVLPRVFGYQHNFCNTALKGHQGGCPAHPGFTGDTALKGANPPCEFMPWVEDHNSHLASIKATYSREKGEVLKKKKREKTTMKSVENWIYGEDDLRKTSATLVNAGLKEAVESANTQRREHHNYNRSILFYISVSKQNINSIIARSTSHIWFDEEWANLRRWMFRRDWFHDY